MSMEQKDKEQLEQLIASEKYQELLSKLVAVIDMEFTEEMPSFTVLNYTHQNLKNAGVTLQEITPVLHTDEHFLNFTILKIDYAKSGTTMRFNKDFLISCMIEFYFLKEKPEGLPTYLKKMGYKSYTKHLTLLKKWFADATNKELVATVSAHLKELKGRKATVKDKPVLTATKEDWERLSSIYPKLCKQVLQDFDEYCVATEGIPLDKITQESQTLGVTFSFELVFFFQHIGELRLEGVEIRFADLYVEDFCGKPYLVLGEFWKYGDGDKLLYDMETQQIFCFAHEYAKPKIIKQADTMTDFVEKKLVSYLKNY